MAELEPALFGKARGEHVYLIKGRSSSLVKIGWSTNIQQRFANIQSMSPAKLDLLWCKPGGVDLESRLHRAFQIRRLHGEWFDFADLDPVAAVEGFLAGAPFPVAGEVGGDFRPFELDQVLEIVAADWPGPRLGRVMRVTTRPGGHSPEYWLEDVVHGDDKPAFMFSTDELRVADPKDHRSKSPWPSDAPGRSRFRAWKIVRRC